MNGNSPINATQTLEMVGCVVIGRNEGERLRQCLQSILKTVSYVVYVDSGSTDGSTELARSLGVEAVELDLSIPFSAARSRNEGFTHLLKQYPHLEFVQFVDGDCEVAGGWLELAQNTLKTQAQVAVVCGRRRERYPEGSIYNRLCDMEWNTSVGEAKACGGDAMMRVRAFQEVGGFNPTLIAGEEPELCVRLRQKDWKILRLEGEMTLHDAQMTRLSQWWKRSLRAGHAYAEGAWLHGRTPEQHWVRESRSIWFWGVFLPLLALVLAGLTRGWSLLLFFAYPLLAYRIYGYLREQGTNAQDSALYAGFCVLGKFSQAQGQLQFWLNRLLGKRRGLVEYKIPSGESN